MIFQVGESRSSFAHIGKVYIQRFDIKTQILFQVDVLKSRCTTLLAKLGFFLIEPKEVFNGATHKTQQKFRGLDKNNPWPTG